MQEPPRSLAVIVPILNEGAQLQDLLSHLESIGAEQLIIVDGGSSDGSYLWLCNHWHDPDRQRWALQSPPGRALQMNTGVRVAQADVLLFLHADTRLPEDARRAILAAREEQYLWGRFDVRFEDAGNIRRAMAVIALFMNIRSRLTSISTGDQAMFVDHVLFRNIGGFELIPLMEDIALSKVLKRHSVPWCATSKATTSARRWQQNGVVRTVLQMWSLRLAYFAGVSPHKLVKRYYPKKEPLH